MGNNWRLELPSIKSKNSQAFEADVPSCSRRPVEASAITLDLAKVSIFPDVVLMSQHVCVPSSSSLDLSL